MKRNLGAASAVALVLAAGLAACGEGETGGAGGEARAESNASARAVRTARVETRSLAGGLNASGQLVAREEAAVGSELAGYRVARVLAEEGDVVGAGQPLVQLDDTLIRSQIDQAIAQLQQQRVAAEQAERQAARVQGLAQEGVLAQEAVEERRYAAQTARTQVASAQAALNELQTRRARLTIRSPVAGRVLERTVRPGDISGGGTTPYFRIARGGLIELEAQLAESELALIQAGDRASVRLPSGQTASGVVRLVDPVVDPQTRLGTVRVLLTPGPGQRVGGFGEATFEGVASTVTAIPEAAIRFDADGPSVMVVGSGNKVRRVPIRTGRRIGGYVEVVQGPGPGTQVLLGGAAFVLEGDVVRPQLVASPATPSRPATAPQAGAQGGGG
jgi:HlyD family secretion protein